MMRFFCVFLLHIQIEGEVRQAISMFKYQIDHKENFVDSEGDSTILPATGLIAMQFVTTLTAEAINLILIIEAGTAKDALMNFVALGVICEIDDLIFLALKKEPLKEAVGSECSPVIVNSTASLNKTGRTLQQVILRKLYQVVKFLYAVYFYFLPVMVIFMAYLHTDLVEFQKYLDKLKG